MDVNSDDAPATKGDLKRKFSALRAELSSEIIADWRLSELQKRVSAIEPRLS